MNTSLLLTLSSLGVMLTLTASASPLLAQPVLAQPVVPQQLQLAPQPMPIAKKNPTRVKDLDRGTSSPIGPTAQSLMTQPITLSTLFMNRIVLTAPVSEVAKDIPSASSQVPQRVDPLDVLKDPNANLNRFFNQPSTIKPPPLEPLEFFKLPGLDSGLKLKMADF
jgi:hypothetical protein